MALDIRRLGPDATTLGELAHLLTATVAAGGSVHFLHPVAPGAAEDYWRSAIADAGRVVLGARLDGRLVGTVTLWLATPPNQPFRAEIWKLMTDPDVRRQGVARALMQAAEALARQHQRTLLTLDTAATGHAQRLYESLGWTRVGEIPDFAFDPFGAKVGALIYYKALPPDRA